MSHRGTVLRRVDHRTARVTAEIDTGVLGCGDLTEGVGSVWVTGCGATPQLVRVDPRENRVRWASPFEAGVGPAFRDGEVWIGSALDRGLGLRAFAPDRPDAGRSVPVPGLVLDAGVAAVGGSIWVADETSAIVYQLDPGSGAVVRAVPVPSDPGGGYLIEHDGAPWYVDAEGGVLVRIDPETGRPRMLRVRTTKPHSYWGIAASTAPGRPGRLWVRNGTGEVWLVDTRVDRVVRRVAVALGGGGDVQEVRGSLWVAAFNLDEVQRVALGPTPG